MTFLSNKSSLNFLVFTCVYITLLSLPQIILGHFDLGWHIAAGDLYRESGEFVTSDPWSYSTGDYPWLNPSWLWGVIYSYVYKWGQLNAVHIVSCLVGALIFVLIFDLCKIVNAGFLAKILATTITFTFLLCYALPDATISASPQTWTLAFWLIVICQMQRNKDYGLIFLPFLFLLWGNIHGGYLLGLATIAIYIFENLLFKNNKRVIDLFLVFAASLFLLGVNPLSMEMIYGTIRTLSSPAKAVITEWTPMSFTEFPITGTYMIISLACLALTHKKLPLSITILGAVLFIFSLSAVRHIVFFLCVTTPAIAIVLTRCLSWLHIDKEKETLEGCRSKKVSLACCVIILIASAYFFTPSNTLQIPQSICPEAEVDYLQKHFSDKKIFNDWNLGGCIIYKTRGAVKVFIDGRAMTAYPPMVMDEFAEFIRTKNFEKFFVSHNFQIAIIPLYRKLMINYFDKANWTREYTGENAVIFSSP